MQDGILASAGEIVNRMGDVKGLYSDVLKSPSDQATYDAEFQDLRAQLYYGYSNLMAHLFVWQEQADALTRLTDGSSRNCGLH